MEELSEWSKNLLTEPMNIPAAMAAPTTTRNKKRSNKTSRHFLEEQLELFKVTTQIATSPRSLPASFKGWTRLDSSNPVLLEFLKIFAHSWFAVCILLLNNLE